MTLSIPRTSIPTLALTGLSSLRSSAVVRVRELTSEALARLLPRVCFGGGERWSRVVQVALSARGLARLGVSEAELAEVSMEVRLGMTSPPSRQRLGDVGRAAPSDEWWTDADHDALLLVYGADDDDVRALVDACAQGLECDPPTFTRLPANNREHFGFRDGITPLRLVESPRGIDELRVGDVVLGAPDSTGAVPRSTRLGDGGTLLAVRELHQDVRAFWDYWLQRASTSADALLQASKAIGRWPNGMPLTPGQETEPPFDADRLNVRSFRDDLHGHGCPFGSHVRRSNPRDTLVVDPDISVEMTRLHLFVRRGRLFGPPAPRACFPEQLWEYIEAGLPDHASSPRGLMFVALCTDLRRQFEFSTQNWLVSPKHADLWDEVDPLLAPASSPGEFTIPTPGFARRVTGVGGWVRPRGGGYYLLPSRSAFEALARGWR